MSEIKVGEYVKLKTGEICRITKYLGTDAGFLDMNCYEIDILYKAYGCKVSREIYEDYIVKHKEKLIELVEVGDILVFKDGSKWEIQEKYQDGSLLTEWNLIESEEKLLENIIGILTKEQFEKKIYKVGE